MEVNVDEKNLKHGVLGLVIALVEIIKDALRTQALLRIEDGSLNEQEIERLGKALMELDQAIEKIKMEQGVKEVVSNIRDGLDNVVEETIDKLLNFNSWNEEGEAQYSERQ